MTPAPSPSALAEAQRILNTAARRILTDALSVGESSPPMREPGFDRAQGSRDDEHAQRTAVT
jgi:hypothetical protein